MTSDTAIAVTLYIFSAERRSEMDNGMEQSLSTMPTVQLSAESNEPFREVVARAIAMGDPGLETIRYYASNEYAYYVTSPSTGMSDSTPYPWTDLAHRQAFDHYFGVAEDGMLVVDDGALRRITLGDLLRGADAGYTQQDWSLIVRVAPMGLGDGTPVTDLLKFLLDHGVDVATAGWWIFGFGRRRRKSARHNELLREIADRWTKGGLYQPWVLRGWLETKREWQAIEVSKRLRITEPAARQLLTALGYERRPGTSIWALGISRRAKRKRKDWVDAEWRNNTLG